MNNFIRADWPAPVNVRAYTTIKPLDLTVDKSRKILSNKLRLMNEPIWLNQQHTSNIITANKSYNFSPADGSYTQEINNVCAVLTADCLPILLCNMDGTEIAALHCGWCGLANGIIKTGVQKFSSPVNEILAWLGPAISVNVYEVGPEVRELFLQRDINYKDVFLPSKNANHWMMDLYRLARKQLNKIGINKIYGGKYCTYININEFYSYRRDGQTGRMANLIWLRN